MLNGWMFLDKSYRFSTTATQFKQGIAAVIPDFVPIEYKVPIAVTSWLAGIIGFSIKEALADKHRQFSLQRTFCRHLF